VGRKNWLFSGTPKGASASATLYSIIESAKANNLEPYRYLRFLFEKIPFASSEDDYKSLLPNRIERPLLTA
jgi:transposase